MKYGLYTDLSNELYHSDNGYLSSSRIKLILESPELYYKKYILKEVKEKSNDSFDVGTAIHAKILEPEVYGKTVTFYSGRRAGKDWEEFKKLNEGKVILSDLQKMQVDRMYESFLGCKIATELVSNGQAETSLFTQLEDNEVKVRADYFSENKSIVIDLKSTSGLISEEKFKYNLESKSYGYDLQAALYVDAYTNQFTKYLCPYNENPLEIQYRKMTKITKDFSFYWIVMSKDFNDIKVFKASKELIEQGRAKYKKALALIEEYEKNGWNFENKVIELYPSNSLGFEF